MEVARDRVGREVAQALPRGDALAQVGGRDGERGDLEVGDVELDAGLLDGVNGAIEVVAGARGGNEMCHAGNARRVMPGDDLGDGVGARDEVELDVFGVELAQAHEGVGRIGHALAVDLEAGGEEVGGVGGREQRHREAVLAGGDLLVELEGGAPGGHEDNDVEVEVGVGLLGRDEVAVVDRVERAAHDADAQARMPVAANGPPMMPRR